ncbi:NRDE family protein [Flavobacterium aquidurense]|uniref:NRDE domain containing protein n=1 Tax=Flavobacterium aquidurense TaxID=362413 RepID=A0A0Q0SE16_9FLAO|nr:NRDE family protein [Flavobacterium aquidurense]KQB42594.1 NRDE domain containing protein [Flavobacterium aquidurense]
MCTVSFINNGGVIIITSNRDEKVIRPAAIVPRNYSHNGKNIMYPKDAKAGGTWFAIDQNGTVLVLLNGGTTKHNPIFPYRKSRGLIALDIIGNQSPKDFWSEINLEDIEPFTLVLFQNGKLYELIWDGLVKMKIFLDSTKNHIWSSVTLYSDKIRKKRSDWFFDFLSDKNEISALQMLDFHRNTESDDSENGLVINRENTMKTLSVTQTVIEKNKGMMKYYDLLNTKDFSTTFIRI